MQIRDCFPPCITNSKYCCDYCRQDWSTSKWISLRRFCFKIVSHCSFEWIILVLIVCSSVTLCFEDIYLDSKPRLKLILFILNTVFTGFFVLEMLLKWLALGLHQYFTSFWTILDVFIVAVSQNTFHRTIFSCF